MLEAITILYVADLALSQQFYERILKLEAISFSPTFSMFFYESGGRLGLVAHETVDVGAIQPSAGFKLHFSVSDAMEVDRLHQTWNDEGIKIIKEPHHGSFAYTFSASDPDGHTLRVFSKKTTSA